MYALKNSLTEIFAMAFTTLIISACASPAILQNTIVKLEDVKADVASSQFEEAIAIVQVDRNRKTNTNPLLNSKIDEEFFEKALQASLKNNGLLAIDQSSNRFNLFIFLESFKQPPIGKHYKVRSNVRYKVVEKKTNVTWFDELISVSFTSPYSKNGLPVGGMRLANEGTVRENIKEFITQLLNKNFQNDNENQGTLSTQDPLSAIQKLHDLQKAMDEGLIKKEKYIFERDKILKSL